MTLSDLLVTHSSPTLAAMKGGSLISLRSLSGKGSFSRRELEGKGLSFLTLTNAKEEKLLLVYRRKRLWEELQDETAQRLLQMEKAAHIQGIYEKCRQVYLRSYRRGVPLERLCITA